MALPAPGWTAAWRLPANALKGEDMVVRPGRFWTLRNLLVISQISISLILLCATGLFLRSLQSAAGIDIGCVLFLLPLAANLSLGRGYGVRGLFLAMLAAGIVRTAMLTWRFRWRTRGAVLYVDEAAQEWTVHAE